MLRARCVSIISRQVYPDLFAGLYDRDEIENFSTQPGRRAPVQHPQQHRAIEPEPIDAVFVPDSQSTDSVRAVPLNRHIKKQQQQPQQHKAVKPAAQSKPQLSDLGFSKACADMGLDRNLVEAWREEVSPKSEWSDFRRGGTVEILRGFGGRWRLAEGIEATGQAAWDLFNSLTDGAAGIAAAAASMDGVEAHESMRGDWLKHHVEAQT